MQTILPVVFFGQNLTNEVSTSAYNQCRRVGFLAHAPDESTTANCVLDNGTRGLASSIILTRPHL